MYRKSPMQSFAGSVYYWVFSHFCRFSKASNFILNWKFKLLSLFAFLFTLLFSFVAFVTLSSYMQIVAIRYLAIWLGVVLSFYWVLSAAWCLYDKDDYGRNVSASDDFYNVAFTSFWLIEGFLLSLFLAYARLFDYYDPFLESDEMEHSLINEDVDGGNLKTLLLCFVTAIFVSLAVDTLITWSSLNFISLLWLSISFFLAILLLFARAWLRGGRGLPIWRHWLFVWARGFSGGGFWWGGLRRGLWDFTIILRVLALRVHCYSPLLYILCFVIFQC